MAQPQLALLVLALATIAGVHAWRVKSGRKGCAVRLSAVTPPVIHGEGPHYDDQQAALYFVDIMGNFINRYDESTGVTTQIQMPTNVTLVVPVQGCDNQLVAGVGRDLSLVTWDGQSSTCQLETIASVDEDKPYNRFNDGKADSMGRLWAGTMGRELAVGVVEDYKGTLYKLERESNEAVPVIQQVSISNGIAWTDDETTMYYIDSSTYSVVAFDYDVAQGTLSSKNRTVYRMDATGADGMPDGMTIDNEGNLWIAVFNGGKVINVNPQTGELLREVQMPAQRVTSVAWGGPQLSELYVTTSRMGLTDTELHYQPLAGCVIRVSGLGVAGRPANRVARTSCQ